MKDNDKPLEKVEPKPLAITPMSMLQMAVEQGADLDKMQQLMSLQERWEANEAKKAYVSAMSDFRAECPTIDKTRAGHNNKFAGLAETIEQIKTILSKNGLSHSWNIEQKDNNITVTTCVTHRQGHQECTSISAPPETSGSKNSIQAIASTISYLERYGLFAMLGLASKDMDDDGNKAGSGDIEWITADQVATLSDLIKDAKSTEALFLKKIKAQSLERIQASAYAGCVTLLENRKKQLEKE